MQVSFMSSTDNNNPEPSNFTSSANQVSVPSCTNTCVTCGSKVIHKNKKKGKKGGKAGVEPTVLQSQVAEVNPVALPVLRHPIYYFEDHDIATVPIKVRDPVLSAFESTLYLTSHDFEYFSRWIPPYFDSMLPSFGDALRCLGIGSHRMCLFSPDPSQMNLPLKLYMA